MRKAFKTLLGLADVCGDFLRQRTQTEIVPKLLQFLSKQLNESKSCRPGYCYTTNYQLQLDALSGLGTLAYRLSIGGKVLWSLILATLPYTNAKQPRPLQEAAHECLKQLQRIEPESVWFYGSMFLKEQSISSNSSSHLVASNVNEYKRLDALLFAV